MVVAMNILTACTATPPARARDRRPLRPHSRAPQEAGEEGVMRRPVETDPARRTARSGETAAARTMRAETRIVDKTPAGPAALFQQLPQRVLQDAAMAVVGRLGRGVDTHQGIELDVARAHAHGLGRHA